MREREREREREISFSNTEKSVLKMTYTYSIYLCFYSVVQKVFSFLQHAVKYVWTPSCLCETFLFKELKTENIR